MNDSSRKYRSALSALAAVALLAVALVSNSPSASADGAAVGRRGAAEAMSQALSTHKQVEVTALASPTTRVMAVPETGGFEAEVTAQVSRVQGSTGEWRDASSRLVPLADGSWGTEATPSRITVGGSDGRLFEFANDSGSVALSWLASLPAPVVEGSSATYESVMPGVDLVVKAQVTGVGTYLVVKDAEAARNPALRKIVFGLKSEGVSTSVEGNSLTFGASRGVAEFALAEPQMWDSRGQELAREAGDLTSVSEEAAVVEMPMKATASTVEIHPDADLLTSPDTVYPVVIDPYVHDDPTYVVRVFSSAYSPHRNQWDEDAKIGYNGWTSPYYKSRMYYNFTLPSLDVDDVESAKFYAKQIHSPQHDCDDHDFGPSVTAGVTTQASSSTTWSNQPTWKSGSVNNDYSVGSEDYCNASYVQKFDLTSAITTAWRSSPKIGIGMKSSNEGDKNGWRHYKQVEGTSTTNADGSVTSTWYPRIVIDYQPTPLAPSAVAASNGALRNGSWAVTNATPTLSAKVAFPGSYTCGSTPTTCLVAEWQLPSGGVYSTAGVSGGITTNLSWPAGEAALRPDVDTQLRVRSKNTANGKVSAWVSMRVMHDVQPNVPVTDFVPSSSAYPLDTPIAVTISSSSPDVSSICWTSSPASPYQGCQPVVNGAGVVTLRQGVLNPDDSPEFRTTKFYLRAVDSAGSQSSPKEIEIYFGSLPSTTSGE